MNHIRPTIPEDLEALKTVLDSIELFPSEMLEDMTTDFFNSPQSEDIWLTLTQNDLPVALSYCAPEQLTEGTYNLYAIGIKSDLQGKGLGSLLMNHLEQLLKTNGHRLLIVDTSGTDDFKQTRQFYKNLGYTKEATLRDFWAEGDDKVVYWKKLK